MRPIDNPKHTNGHSRTLQRDKIQLHPTEHSHKTLQPRNINKELVQPQPQREDAMIKKNYEIPACRQDILHAVN